MTTTSSALLALTALIALVDWWAVGTGRRPVELVAKPLTLVALIGVAVTLDPVDPTVRAWFVVALVFSLGGDTFLMFERHGERWFIAGLASFLLGHVAYVVGFWSSGDIETAPLLVGVVVVAVSLATLGRHILVQVRRADPAMVPPVAGYVLVISAMVASAIGTADAWAIVGSLLFYASDALIAWNKFIDPRPWGRLAIITTYHLGQIGLVLSLAA